jgi:hypothetical protein
LRELRKLFAVVRRLGSEKILLNAKGNLFGSNEDDGEEAMRLAVDELVMIPPHTFGDILPGDTGRSLACLSSEINALISHTAAL